MTDRTTTRDALKATLAKGSGAFDAASASEDTRRALKHARGCNGSRLARAALHAHARPSSH
eukprot:6461340-Prymnesium_polylepis.1